MLPIGKLMDSSSLAVLADQVDQFDQSAFKHRSTMPYKSEKQRKYLHSQKPEVARKYDKHGGKGKALPAKVAAPKRGTNKRGRSK